MSVTEQVWAAVAGASDKAAAIAEARAALHELSDWQAQPIDLVRWVPIEQVQANDYNPNNVAKVELGLLYTSIDHDGYTQPVVTIYDPATNKYVIVDGFHRYHVMRSSPDLLARCHGCLPIVVIDKEINDRMASTVRHNRARGKHSVKGMSSMVFTMLDNGWTDAEICNELGMEPEELLRLKHITGFSKLFADAEYSQAWVAKNQIRLKHQWAEAHPDEQMPADFI
jgi:ParB-like chromosome segregation protein Spo0J